MASTVVAAQLYTVRDFTKTPADIAATIRKVADIGYRAVQSSAVGPIAPKDFRKICDDHGVEICATHVPFERLRDETASVVEEHAVLGCRYPAIGGLPKVYRDEGGSGFSRFAKEASEVARRLKAAGLTFAYHNHSFEFERFGGRTAMDIMFAESDPAAFQFEIDTYWVQHGGADPAAWVRKAKGRADLVHVKDMEMKGRDQLFSEVGEGNLNWPAILSACVEAGTRWYIVEQDRCQRDPFESLAISLRNLKKMGLS